LYFMPDEYLCVAQVAEVMGLHKNTVWKYIRTGIIPAIKLGEHRNSPLRVSRFALENKMEEILYRQKGSS